MTLHSAARIRREWHTSSHVPYLSHVSEHIVSTRAGDYVQVFRLGGLGFETADDARLNNWHERLNVLWRNLASPHVALWTHIVRPSRVSPDTCTSGTGNGCPVRS
jgi:type IV secretion system protein VirB4